MSRRVEEGAKKNPISEIGHQRDDPQKSETSWAPEQSETSWAPSKPIPIGKVLLILSKVLLGIGLLAAFVSLLPTQGWWQYTVSGERFLVGAMGTYLTSLGTIEPAGSYYSGAGLLVIAGMLCGLIATLNRHWLAVIIFAGLGAALCLFAPQVFRDAHMSHPSITDLTEFPIYPLDTGSSTVGVWHLSWGFTANMNSPYIVAGLFIAVIVIQSTFKVATLSRPELALNVASSEATGSEMKENGPSQSQMSPGSNSAIDASLTVGSSEKDNHPLKIAPGSQGNVAHDAPTSLPAKKPNVCLLACPGVLGIIIASMLMGGGMSSGMKIGLVIGGIIISAVAVAKGLPQAQKPPIGIIPTIVMLPGTIRRARVEKAIRPPLSIAEKVTRGLFIGGFVTVGVAILVTYTRIVSFGYLFIVPGIIFTAITGCLFASATASMKGKARYCLACNPVFIISQSWQSMALCQACYLLLSDDERALFRSARRYPIELQPDAMKELIASVPSQVAAAVASHKAGGAPVLVNFAFDAGGSLVMVSTKEMRVFGKNSHTTIPFNQVASVAAGTTRKEVVVVGKPPAKEGARPRELRLIVSDPVLTADTVIRRMQLHLEYVSQFPA